MNTGRVFIYWNLHKKCWSVRDVKTRKVVKHLTSLALYDCEFKVSEAGRQRVLREKRKHVHAGVVGNLLYDNIPPMYHPPGPITENKWQVRYNPYEVNSFQLKDTGSPIQQSDAAYFFPDRSVYVAFMAK